jgi:hypothetical protein
VVIHGEPPAKVFADLRSRRDQVAYQPLRSQLAPRAFTVTIADLGEFTAETYETRLRGWARAALEAWSGEAAG